MKGRDRLLPAALRARLGDPVQDLNDDTARLLVGLLAGLCVGFLGNGCRRRDGCRRRKLFKGKRRHEHPLGTRVKTLLEISPTASRWMSACHSKSLQPHDCKRILWAARVSSCFVTLPITLHPPKVRERCSKLTFKPLRNPKAA